MDMDINKKIYIWGWTDPDFKRIILSLQGRSDCDVLNLEMALDTNIMDIIIHKPHLLKVLPCCKVEIFREILLEDILTFSDMYSRVRVSQGKTIQEVSHLFWWYVHYFFNELLSLKPNVLMFNSPPHYGADFILYRVAQLLNIEVKIFYQSLFENHFFCVNRIENIGALGELEDVPEHRVINFKLDNFINQEWFYMKGVKFKNQPCLKNFLKQFFIKRFSKKKLLGSAAFQNYENCLVFNNHSKQYDVIENLKDQKYVYFPLQLQPEMTTSALGSVYADQISAIEAIACLIPNDWKIYIKENPKQTGAYRGGWFYRRLVTISEVTIVSPSLNSIELIKNSQFVGVITGTAGWEALLYNKPTLSFGYAWYNALPGVIKYHSKLELKDILTERPTKEVIEYSLNYLLSTKAFYGVIDEQYAVLVDSFDSSENHKNILRALSFILDLKDLSK